MELFGVGIGEAILVLLITLIVVGPERFPQIAREGGKYYRMARRFTAEVTGDLRVALDELENEVKEQSGDLKAVREIGNDVRAGVAESTSDINSIGETVREAASTDAASDATGGVQSAAAPAESSEDMFARIRESYAEYHQPATPEPSASTSPEVDADAMSQQAVEAFEEFRKPEEDGAAAAPPPAAPYSPQQLVGVNPFATASPPAATVAEPEPPAPISEGEQVAEPAPATPPRPATPASGA
jgi:sec-independent protein translocase protein TatB